MQSTGNVESRFPTLKVLNVNDLDPLTRRYLNVQPF